MLGSIIIPLVRTSTIQGDGHKQWAGGWAVPDPIAPPPVPGDPFPRAAGGQGLGLASPDFSSILADVLHFDNTHSLRHSRKVSYTVEVLLPDKASEEKIQGIEATRPTPAQ